MAESEIPADTLSTARPGSHQVRAHVESAETQEVKTGGHRQSAARGGNGARESEGCEPLGAAPRLAQYESFGATYAALGMLAFPGIAAVATTVLFLSNDMWSGTVNSSGSRALLVGTIVALVAQLVLTLALKPMSSPRGAVPTAWSQLDEERANLRARFDRLTAEQKGPSTVLPEARRAILAAEERLEAEDARADWIVAVGYVSVWRHLHRADEAMLEACTDEELVAAACHDYLRVAGSTMPQAPALTQMIDAAAEAIEPGSLAALRAATATRGAAPDAVSKPIARLILRQSRRAINDFRDGSRMGLVRARNALVLTIGATGLLAYLLFGLALLGGASRNEIAAAAAFFVVAALVGLFYQLQLASSRDTICQEDFGLQAVRLIHTPLFSGIAGVAGVVLTRIVTDTPATMDLPAIFNIHANRLDLVIAAAFGLTPALLISQLRSKAESYKSDLKYTEAGQGTAPRPQ
jgi:hypothetical protein